MTTTRLNPYLNFRDTARAAMDFYAGVLGGELTVTTFGEAGGMGMPEAEHHKVMHAMLVTGPDVTLMAADVPPGMDLAPNGSVSLSGDDEPVLRGWWEGLTDGGQVVVPLEKAPWGDHFGMCTDKFGVSWMVNITAG